MPLDQQEACDFVIGRLSVTLGPRRVSLSDLASGALVFALLLSIAVVGGRHAFSATHQLLLLDAYARIEARFAALDHVQRRDQTMADARPEISITATGGFRRR